MRCQGFSLILVGGCGRDGLHDGFHKRCWGGGGCKTFRNRLSLNGMTIPRISIVLGLSEVDTDGDKKEQRYR